MSPRLLSGLLLPALAAQASALQIHGEVGTEAGRTWRIKAYYINKDSSVERAKCMQAQLDKLEAHASEHNLEIVSERFPAVTFSPKCEDTESCIAELPSCFPSGRGFASHGNPLADPEEVKSMLRGVFGDACSHLRVLQRIAQERKDYDYFLVLEDDVDVSMAILESFAKLFSRFPDHWTMITIDSFSWPERPIPEPDMIDPKFTSGLPLTGISATRRTNWGSQAWLLNSRQVGLFLDYYAMQPTMNADWYTKLPRPLHLGIWGFTPGQMQQIRFVDDSVFSALPSQCRDDTVTKSDIAEMAFRIPYQHTLRQVPKLTRNILLFGMPGTHLGFLRDIIPPELCEYQKAKGGCHGVPFDLPPGDWWSQIAENRSASDPLRQAVAVVVVRHPFALVEELYSRGYSVSSARKELRYSKECAKKRKWLWAGVTCHWNSLMSAYALASAKGIFHKVVFLRFEDIVTSPEISVERLEEAAGPFRSRENVGMGALRTSSDVVVDLNQLQYRTSWGCKRLLHMCERINKEYLWQFGYHGCQWFSSNFTDQVFEGASRKPQHFADCEQFRDPLDVVTR